MVDLIVLGYVADYLPLFAELDGQPNVHLIPPHWGDERELLHFLLRMDLAYKKGKLPFLPNRNPLAGEIAFSVRHARLLYFFSGLVSPVCQRLYTKT